MDRTSTSSDEGHYVLNTEGSRRQVDDPEDATRYKDRARHPPWTPVAYDHYPAEEYRFATGAPRDWTSVQIYTQQLPLQGQTAMFPVVVTREARLQELGMPR